MSNRTRHFCDCGNQATKIRNNSRICERCDEIERRHFGMCRTRSKSRASNDVFNVAIPRFAVREI